MRPRDPARLDPGVRFTDEAERAGCRNQHTRSNCAAVREHHARAGSVGAAVAAADFDGTAAPTLCHQLRGRGSPNRLFRNQGDGTFEDVAERSGVACKNPRREHACEFGDVDGDGRDDLSGQGGARNHSS